MFKSQSDSPVAGQRLGRRGSPAAGRAMACVHLKEEKDHQHPHLIVTKFNNKPTGHWGKEN